MDKDRLNEILAIDSLQFVPIASGKRPSVDEWQSRKVKYQYDTAIAVGLVCGAISNGVEVVDVDAHHDASGTILKDYKDLINEQSTTLLKKLVVQKTMSGGVHLIYRCSVNEGNKKLANEKRNEKNEILSLIETRGTGGQVLVEPSPGYKIVQGNLKEIPEITPEEREILWSSARALNRNTEDFQLSPKKQKEMEEATPGETPWAAFDARGNWREVLETAGWKYVKRKGEKHYFLRPGDSKAEYSGDFHEGKNSFGVFSTSSIFEVGKNYSPYQLYAILHHNKDFSEAAKALLKQGFGNPPPRKPVDKQSFVYTEERPKITVENSADILADWNEIEAYLSSVSNGTLKMGLPTGMPDLDKHWLLKESYFVMVNGFDNVGKSTFMWYVAMLSALFHGWRWAFLCMENKAGPVIKRLMEFYWSRPLELQSAQQQRVAKEFVRAHFFPFSIQKGWSYPEVLDGFSAYKAKEGIKAGLIDPYRSLVFDTKNEYGFHSRAGNEFKRFAQQEDVSIYVNIHATTGAARTYNKQTNSQKPPTKADVEYGGAWTGPVDDFLTVHRLLGHHELKYQTQVFVRKIKERETGGDWTSDASPVLLKMPKGVHYTGVDGFNPIERYHDGWRPEQIAMNGKPAKNGVHQSMDRAINGFEMEKPSIEPVRNFYEPEKEEHQYTLEPDLNDPGF